MPSSSTKPGGTNSKNEKQDQEELAVQENAEDMLLAFQLLDKYKHDSKFIQKDLTKLKR